MRTQEPVEGLEMVLHEALPPAQRKRSKPPNPRVLKLVAVNWVTASSVGDVFAWGMPALQDIDLSGCDLGIAGCALLTNVETDLAEHFEGWQAPPPFAPGQLKRLVLHGCSLGDAGAQLLFGGKNLAALRLLDISQCRLVQSQTLEALRASPHLKQLVLLSWLATTGSRVPSVRSRGGRA